MDELPGVYMVNLIILLGGSTARTAAPGCGLAYKLISSIYNFPPPFLVRGNAKLALTLRWRHEFILKVLSLLLNCETSVFLDLVIDLFVSEFLDLTVIIQENPTSFFLF